MLVQGVLPCVLVLEVNHKLYLGAPAPWSFGGSPASLRPSGLVWSGDDDFLRGRGDPLPWWKSSLLEIGIKVTGDLA